MSGSAALPLPLPIATALINSTQSSPAKATRSRIEAENAKAKKDGVIRLPMSAQKLPYGLARGMPRQCSSPACDIAVVQPLFKVCTWPPRKQPLVKTLSSEEPAAKTVSSDTTRRIAANQQWRNDFCSHGIPLVHTGEIPDVVLNMQRSASLGGTAGVVFKASGVKEICSLRAAEAEAAKKQAARAERLRREKVMQEDVSRCAEQITNAFKLRFVIEKQPHEQQASTLAGSAPVPESSSANAEKRVLV
mmetsp:Transcript_70997/g.112215  ORF Transcript_70997/g.112215 Transcript_70997/m.112215 type:complete len:248 (-) Transcript_70997:24-767(-)